MYYNWIDFLLKPKPPTTGRERWILHLEVVMPFMLSFSGFCLAALWIIFVAASIVSCFQVSRLFNIRGEFVGLMGLGAQVILFNLMHFIVLRYLQEQLIAKLDEIRGPLAHRPPIGRRFLSRRKG
jgi:hypothetical protein